MKKLLFLLFIFHSSLFISTSSAQWKQLNSGVNYALGSIFFTYSLKGYVIGDGGMILKTIDGGNNWIKIPTDYTFDLVSTYFTDDTTGYIVGRKNYSNNTHRSLILKTINGGKNWTEYDSISNELLRQVYFPDKNHGYIVGSNAIIIKTSDAGLHWIVSWDQYVNFDQLMSVYFTDSITGYISGDDMGGEGAIAYTTDGGLNWKFQDSLSSFMFTSINFPTKDTGYAVGLDLVKTVNGGKTWMNIEFGGTQCFFTDGHTGYKLNYARNIYNTTDGGYNWVDQTHDVTGVLNSIYFPDINHGYVSGYNGQIWKYTNQSVVINELQTANSKLITKISPNPAHDQTTITYNLPEPAQVTISLFDLTGREIRSWKLEAGNLKNENKTTINTSDLNAGIYFLQLQTANSSSVAKFIKQ
jgi:photosystem II stability/assembly factor-like uncharacterized protein